MISNRELIDKFVESAVNAVATVERIYKNQQQLTEALLRATAEDESVLLAEPDDLDTNLFTEFRKSLKVICNPTKDQFRNVRTGVTDAFCAVASTGSVCVSVTKNLSSPISMLTRKHIVVVDGSSIVPRPRDLFSGKYGKGLTGSFSFITGTSATADMGPLVRGVHGPGKLHIIVLE
jgi:L-lactate dehydrogenase complex protein LldG